ncbi:MAG: 3-oxoacyl-ACP synthase, partial [Hyphomicrobiaceae bacterium]|nr:3-oxoacyl-ACP synthase [Hyphomicrobiaceae bacterium]
FGDGAGAVVLEAFETDDPMDGLIASKLRADGQHRQKLFVDGGVSSTQTSGHLRMEGREVFRHAVGMINDVIEDTLGAAGLTTADLDWFIPHQANVRIIDASARHLKIDPAKVVLTVDKHGNTSAASIPLALDTAVRDGRVKAGDVILFEAMGGGFTWGACLMRWSGSGS